MYGPIQAVEIASSKEAMVAPVPSSYSQAQLRDILDSQQNTGFRETQTIRETFSANQTSVGPEKLQNAIHQPIYSNQDLHFLTTHSHTPNLTPQQRSAVLQGITSRAELLMSQTQEYTDGQGAQLIHNNAENLYNQINRKPRLKAVEIAEQVLADQAGDLAQKGLTPEAIQSLLELTLIGLTVAGGSKALGKKRLKSLLIALPLIVAAAVSTGCAPVQMEVNTIIDDIVLPITQNSQLEAQAVLDAIVEGKTQDTAPVLKGIATSGRGVNVANGRLVERAYSWYELFPNDQNGVHKINQTWWRGGRGVEYRPQSPHFALDAIALEPGPFQAANLNKMNILLNYQKGIFPVVINDTQLMMLPIEQVGKTFTYPGSYSLWEKYFLAESAVDNITAMTNVSINKLIQLYEETGLVFRGKILQDTLDYLDNPIYMNPNAFVTAEEFGTKMTPEAYRQLLESKAIAELDDLVVEANRRGFTNIPDDFKPSTLFTASQTKQMFVVDDSMSIVGADELPNGSQLVDPLKMEPGKVNGKYKAIAKKLASQLKTGFAYVVNEFGDVIGVSLIFTGIAIQNNEMSSFCIVAQTSLSPDIREDNQQVEKIVAAGLEKYIEAGFTIDFFGGVGTVVHGEQIMLGLIEYFSMEELFDLSNGSAVIVADMKPVILSDANPTQKVLQHGALVPFIPKNVTNMMNYHSIEYHDSNSLDEQVRGLGYVERVRLEITDLDTGVSDTYIEFVKPYGENRWLIAKNDFTEEPEISAFIRDDKGNLWEVIYRLEIFEDGKGNYSIDFVPIDILNHGAVN